FRKVNAARRTEVCAWPLFSYRGNTFREEQAAQGNRIATMEACRIADPSGPEDHRASHAHGRLKNCNVADSMKRHCAAISVAVAWALSASPAHGADPATSGRA